MKRAGTTTVAALAAILGLSACSGESEQAGGGDTEPGAEMGGTQTGGSGAAGAGATGAGMGGTQTGAGMGATGGAAGTTAPPMGAVTTDSAATPATAAP